MCTLTDFNYQPHRTVSAAVAFQKGIYHLFLLRRNQPNDCYEQIIRTYQCIFQLCVTLVLLDEAFLISLKDLQRLSASVKKLCSDPKNPRRNEIDPACVLNHSAILNWPGLISTHPLAQPAAEAKALVSRTADARHNLLYRPFLLDDTDPGFEFGPFWEDCTLKALIGGTPMQEEVEVVYSNFASAIWTWRKNDKISKIPSDFIFALFTPYEDTGNKQPTETALIRYARMLSGDDCNFLGPLKSYRNQLIDQNGQAPAAGIAFDPKWKVGEI